MKKKKMMINLYWSIGEIISEKQKNSDWGSNVIERLANDLQKEFPGMGGFSRANIFRMQAFYKAYEKVAQLVRQIDELSVFGIPWGHNIRLLQKLKSNNERLWYAQKAMENGWSRSVLEMQIKLSLFKRQGKAVTNFSSTLPAPNSDMAQQSLKDPYIFDFLTLQEDHLERDIEQGLIDPRDTGQISFYLSAIDDNLKQQGDKPTIGLLLCRSKKSLLLNML